MRIRSQTKRLIERVRGDKGPTVRFQPTEHVEQMTAWRRWGAKLSFC